MGNTTLTRKRPRIFYGWYIVGIAMVGSFMAAGMSQVFMGVMLKPVTSDLGWSRTATSGAITAGTLTAGLLSPFLGRLVDRHGPRLLAPAGAVFVALAFFALAGLTALWQFYIAYIVGRSVSSVTLSGVVPMTAATNWFFRRRGPALGFIAMSLPLGGSFLAFTGQLIIDASGWRDVFAVFGVALLVVFVIPALLIMRRRPEDIGLSPDGDDDPRGTDASNEMGSESEEEYGWALNEAVRTRSLWFLIIGLTLGITANGAIGFHQVAYYTDVGIAAKAAALTLSVYAFAGAVANGLWGFLVERFSERKLAVLAMLASALAIFYLLFVRNTVQALIFAVLFGLSARGESSLVMMILARYYGRRSYGTITGFVTPFQMMGLGFGPLIASISFDITGSYKGVFFVFAASFLVAAVLMFLAKKPKAPSKAGLRVSVAV